MITEFRGEYRFLSNFYPSTVYLYGVDYPTVEHAYQAAKCGIHSDRLYIRSASTPGEAKKRGRNIQIRSDWDEIKLKVMDGLLRQKFANDTFQRKLLDTGDQDLIEGNNWGDTFWGVCKGRGENWLGILLMKIRDDIRRMKGFK